MNGLAPFFYSMCYVWLLIDSKAELSSDVAADAIGEACLPLSVDSHEDTS